MSCQPGTWAIHSYGQKLTPGQALRQTGHVRRLHLCLQNWAFGASPLFRVFSVREELEEGGQMGFTDCAGARSRVQPNNLLKQIRTDCLLTSCCFTGWLHRTPWLGLSLTCHSPSVLMYPADNSQTRTSSLPSCCLRHCSPSASLLPET